MELDLSRLEQEFIAEGTGNGDLWPIILSEPDNYEDHDDDDVFVVPFNFHYRDWDALYFGELKCPEYESYVEGEDMTARHNRWMAKFQECCAEFPLLSRIHDMYADAIFSPDEVHLLKAQCETLLSLTEDKGAWRALAKLIVICNKAKERNKGILLACD